MAILLINIENENSLAFNEFFDYNGFCYASTRSREKHDGKVIDMDDFYEAAMNTELLRDIPVVFLSVEEEITSILGWYRKAEIHSKMLTPSLFLEGNVKAYTSDAVWLSRKMQSQSISISLDNQLYEVIEEEDARYHFLNHMILHFSGKNQMMPYHSASVHTIPQAMKDVASCKAACQQWAELVIGEECQDIRDLKTLEAYAKKLCQKDRKNSDGYYYLALASYHLGFVKEGLKQINKALSLEPEASDLLALKGLLLVSRGYIQDGAAHLHQAYEKSQYQAYLLMEGKAFLMAGMVDRAYDCLKDVEDESLLETMGMKPKDMESKFHFIKMKYMRLRDRIKGNSGKKM